MNRTCRKQKPSASQQLHFQSHVCRLEPPDLGAVIAIIEIPRVSVTLQIRKVHGEEGRWGYQESVSEGILPWHPSPAQQREISPQQNCLEWGLTVNLKSTQCLGCFGIPSHSSHQFMV